MTQPSGHIDPVELRSDIGSYRNGDEAAGDRLCRRLQPAVRLATARMLGDADAEVDDVVQDALVACLGYMVGDEEFAGDPTRLAVTIARNRCRDILRNRQRRPQVDLDTYSDWLSDQGRSALDELAADDLRRHLQLALDRLSSTCRRLLRALYVEDRTPEQVRRIVGLGTVQGIYHRRKVCLGQVRKFLQMNWRFGSGDGVSPGTDRGATPTGQEP